MNAHRNFFKSAVHSNTHSQKKKTNNWKTWQRIYWISANSTISISRCNLKQELDNMNNQQQVFRTFISYKEEWLGSIMCFHLLFFFIDDCCHHHDRKYSHLAKWPQHNFYWGSCSLFFSLHHSFGVFFQFEQLAFLLFLENERDELRWN